ncbi:class I SAM-dependent methyltransferase [Clostridiaceae bacterium M8S5]|nr:class I SAM-dependent methyltransferase [Clostridiaceae bacterium M8S5]
MEKFNNATSIAKLVMSNNIKPNSLVVDATMGNGNDTLQLAKLVKDQGKVYSFDIQIVAIEKTREKLLTHNLLDTVVLINDTHENIDTYIESNIDFAVFNLGYLPSGDHTIVTKPSSTIKALELCLNKLNANGIVTISIYYGHNGGIEEKKAVEDYLSSLPQKEYNIVKMDFINQANNPPILIVIEKRK